MKKFRGSPVNWLAGGTLILCSIQVSAQLKIDTAFRLDGFRREFIAQIPSGKVPDAGYPVVLMLHSASHDKEEFYYKHGWKELGEKENFITVFPSSLHWCYIEKPDSLRINHARWVTSELIESACPEDRAKLISDLHFLESILDWLILHVAIDTHKVFASGFSDGSRMSHKLANQATHRIKAVGHSSGGYHPGDTIMTQVRVPNWFMVGTEDERFIVPPYNELPFGGDSILSYMHTYLVRILRSQGLTDRYTLAEGENAKTYMFTECRPGVACAPYFFSLLKGMGHQYPNGENHPVDGPKWFWNFFCNPPSTTTSVKDDLPNSPFVLTAYPNPASDQMTLSLSSDQEALKEVVVMTASGTLLIAKPAVSGMVTLTKSEVGSGMFLVQATTKKGHLFSKVAFY